MTPPVFTVPAILETTPETRRGHIAPASAGEAWQLINQGVRPVLIRRWESATTAEVSRRGGPLIERQRDWAPHTTPSPIADLFLIEQDARIEYRRRRDLDRSPADRRCRA